MSKRKKICLKRVVKILEVNIRRRVYSYCSRNIIMSKKGVSYHATYYAY